MPEDWLTSLRDKYNHPREVGAQVRAARAGLLGPEEMLLRHFPPPAEDALVLGCGAGRECLYLAARGWRVTGVDLAAVPLAACRRSLASRQLRAELVLLQSPHPLPFKRQSFSAVLLYGQIIEHLPVRADRLALLREVARMLGPGGRAYLSAHAVEPRDQEELSHLARAGSGPTEIGADRISAASSPGRLRLYLYSREEMLADLGEAALSPVAYMVEQEPGPGHPVWRRFHYCVVEGSP